MALFSPADVVHAAKMIRAVQANEGEETALLLLGSSRGTLAAMSVFASASAASLADVATESFDEVVDLLSDDITALSHLIEEE